MDWIESDRSILGSKSTSSFLLLFSSSFGQMILFLSLSDLILSKITALLDESWNFWVFEGWFLLRWLFSFFCINGDLQADINYIFNLLLTYSTVKIEH